MASLNGNSMLMATLGTRSLASLTLETFLAATAAVRGGVQQEGCGGEGRHGRHCGRGGLHGVPQCTPAGPALSLGCRRAQVLLQ